MDFCAFCDAALFRVWYWTRTLAKRLYCRAADAYYQTEHHCCTDNSLQCIMRSGMDSASDRVHFITSLVPAQLSDCNAIRRHHPSLEGRSLCGLIIWRALLSLGSATVYPCDTKRTRPNQTWLVCDNFTFGADASEPQLSSKMRAIVLHSAEQLNSPPERC